MVDLDSVPRLAPGVALLELSADYQGVIERLRRGRPVRDVPRRSVVVADRELPSGSVEVLQLSALSAAVIRLCDRVRTVRDLSGALALSELARQGLLAIRQ